MACEQAPICEEYSTRKIGERRKPASVGEVWVSTQEPVNKDSLHRLIFKGCTEIALMAYILHVKMRLLAKPRESRLKHPDLLRFSCSKCLQILHKTLV